MKVHGHGPVDTREDFISFHCIVLCVSKKNHVLNTKPVHFLTVQYPNTIDNFFITLKHIFVRSTYSKKYRDIQCNHIRSIFPIFIYNRENIDIVASALRS